jgi:CDP-paratose 2-epimerase
MNKSRGELFILDNLYRNGSEENLKWLKSRGKFKFYNIDIRIKNKVEKVIHDVNPDVIFHLAGQVAMTTSVSNPQLDFEVNALGTFNILDSVRKYAPETVIVYSSTNKVYGDLEWVEYKELEKRYAAPAYLNGFSEDIPLNFSSPYGCSKGAADQYVLDFSRTYGLKAVVFRHSSIYGGRQFSTYDQGWIGWFCQKAIEASRGILKEPFTISGNGKQVRDVLYVEDAVRLYFSAVEAIDKVKSNAFNIGGSIENSLSLLELFDILEQELGRKLIYTKIPWRKSDQKIFVADITKYKGMSGWYPKIDKIDGIKKMLSWINHSLIL